MSLRFVAGLVLALFVLVAGAESAQAKRSPPSTAPGRYEGWGPDIDRVEIFKAFRFADYERIAVEPLATDAIELPPADENTYEPVKAVLGRFTEVLTGSLREELDRPVETVGTAAGAHVLRLRGKVLLLDPGSRAKRYWGGFGAGAARVEVRCELVDGASGEVLLAFTQQRRSGVGGFGGGYEELMIRTIRQIGEDTANLLRQF